MKNYIPYCYLIGWSDLDIWYYGSEYANRSKIANPTNLWTIYFTSSTKVKEFVKLHGIPDVIKIRKTFTSAEETILWEYRVLQKLNVRHNDRWLNVNDGKAPIGKPWSEEKKKKQSTKVSGSGNPMYGKTHTTKTKELISERSGKSGSENGMFGKTHTEEAKIKMGENHEYTYGENHHNFGMKHTAEVKARMSKSHKPKIFSYNHLTHGNINATMRQMMSLYPELKFSGLKALSGGRIKCYKGWFFPI